MRRSLYPRGAVQVCGASALGKVMKEHPEIPRKESCRTGARRTEEANIFTFVYTPYLQNTGLDI